MGKGHSMSKKEIVGDNDFSKTVSELLFITYTDLESPKLLPLMQKLYDLGYEDGHNAASAGLA